MSAPQHRARKRFGQNFLTDQNIIDRIVYDINPQPNEHLIEIGPGLGALTKPILSQAQKLTVIELDRDIVPKLQTNCMGIGELNVIGADVLQVNFARLATTNKKLRVIGNLPYNISTPLLFHLMQYRDVITDMHFMLQKEVVNRLAAEPNTKAYGRLSVMIQLYCEVEPLIDVPPTSFEPQPKVDSQIVRLIPKPNLNITAEFADSLSQLVKQAFSQRRKTIWNNLKDFPGMTKEKLLECGIDPGCRAEDVKVDGYVALTTKQVSSNFIR